MTDTITYQHLLTACALGGPSLMTVKTELRPGAGDLAGVAPARYVDGSTPTYAYETRWDGDEAVTVVVLDSKGSAINRVEAAIAQAIRDGHPVLKRVPRVTVTYLGQEPMMDLDVPHRWTDAHFRAGTIDGKPTTDDPRYRAMRDATPANASAILTTSPVSLGLGVWDSTRKARQARYRSALVGEVIGIVADQSAPPTPPKRGAARFDTIAPSVRLSGPDLERLVARQESELSEGNVAKIRKEISKVKDGTVSASGLGLGSIPPSMTGLGFVSCRRIVRHHVLSFAALRQIRFGLGTDGDTAARALIAAVLLNGLTRSNEELNLRANCDLVEASPTVMELDQRQGEVLLLRPLAIDEADDLLAVALDTAEKYGISWQGQTLDVIGDPAVAGGIDASEES